MPRMAHIPTRNTAPERILRAALKRIGAGPIAANDSGLPGSPDVVLPAHRTVLFAHGCFWHHHAGCRCARIPATSYPWVQKFQCNRERDLANRDALLRQGWRVGWVWECATTGTGSLTLQDLGDVLRRFLEGEAAVVEVAGSQACHRSSP